MDRIKQQVEQLQGQLAGLSASQKMLSAALVAIMAATVVWWAAYAAEGDRVPLLDQPLAAEQLGAIQSKLAARGIEHTVEGDRLMVAASRRDEALAMLTYERAMPADTSNHFEAAIGQMGSFDSRDKADAVRLNALQQKLAGIFRNLPGVRSADVIVNPHYKARIGESVEPSASVNLMVDSVNADEAQRLAEAASRTVAGAVSMLKPENVTVLVNGRPMDVDGGDSLMGGASRLLQVRRDNERHFEEKVRRALGFIPGLHVSVGVEVNDTVSRKSSFSVDPTNKIVAAVEESTQSEEQTGGASAGAEAGVIPNNSMSLASSAGASPGASKTRESGETRNQVDYGKTREETYREAGAVSAVSCSLSVPMSWVVEQFRGLGNAGTTSSAGVDVAALEAFKVEQMGHLRSLVASALQEVDEGQITVMSYADGATLAAGGPGAFLASNVSGGGPTTEATAGFVGLARDYGKPVALVALAGVSLFLVSSMVKKTAPLTPPAPPTFDGQPVTLYGEGGAIGHAVAGAADSLLLAQEVGDDEVYAAQMLEQVQSLVKENPEAAASLVKRWLNVG